MDPSERRDELAIEAALLERLIEDRQSGRLVPLSDYEALHPGREDVVRRVYAQMEGSHRDAGTSAGATALQASDSKIGRFRIQAELGRGGQAIVYRAEDPTLHRTVALKVLTVGAHLSENSLRRFRREAEIASRLEHPGICPVYDTGVDGGLTWIAMRYVEGETLARRIAAARHSEGRDSVISAASLEKSPTASSSASSAARAHALRVIAFMEKVARTLHAAHEAGVVHRDVKPGNIMVLPDGEPVVLDFGLARTEDAAASLVTQTGDFLGTPSYMAPEQLAGPTELVDRRADVWGLGVTLYESLTLKRPFEDSTRGGLEESIRSRDPSRVRRENSQVPRDLDAIVEKALEKNPRRRYATAAELADDLHRVLVHEPVKARPAGPLLRAQRWVQRNPIAATLILVLVAGLATSLLLLHEISTRGQATQTALRHSQALGMTQTVRELLETDPALALHVALQAYDLEPTLPEAVSAIHGAVAIHHPVLELHHGDSVVSACTSPDGKRVLTASTDKCVRIWNADDGHEIHCFEGHAGYVLSATWSPSRDRIVTASFDSTARLLDQDLREVARLDHPGVVSSAVFTPDGHRIVTGCNDGFVRVWDLAGQKLLERQASRYPVFAEDSPDGDRILTRAFTLLGASRDYEFKAQLWSSDLVPIGEPLQHGDQIMWAAFSPRNESLATASMDGTAVIWDRDGRRQKTLERHTSGLTFVTYSTNGTRIVTCSYDRTARVWDAKTGELLHELRGHGGTVAAAAFSEDDELILTGGRDLQPRLWDSEGFLLDVFRGHTRGESNFLIGLFPRTKGSPRLFAAAFSGTMLTWDAWPSELPVLYGHRGRAEAVAFAPDGSGVVTGGEGVARVWSSDGTLRRSFDFGAASVMAIGVSRDGRWLAAGCRDNLIRIRSIAEGGASIDVPVNAYPVSIAFSPTQPLFAASIMHGFVGLWGMDGQLVRKFEYGQMPHESVFSPDGRHVLAAYFDGSAVLWRVDGTSSQDIRGDPHRLNCVAFHSSGKEFLTAGIDGQIVRWDLQGRTIGVIRGPEQEVRFLDCSPDGTLVAASYVDGSVRLWRLDGVLVAQLAGHFAPTIQVRFSPDGSRLLTASEDGTCRYWFARTEDLLRYARGLDSRPAQPGK